MLRASTLIVALGVFLPSFAQADCLKEVFERFCLGGAVETLPNDETLVAAGPAEHIYRDGNSHVIAEVEAGKIISVLRVLLPDNALTFSGHLGRLRERYGPGDNLDDLPGYARTPPLIEHAVKVGAGRMIRSWDQGDWSVRLGWTEDAMILLYMAGDIEQPRHQM